MSSADQEILDSLFRNIVKFYSLICSIIIQAGRLKININPATLIIAYIRN